MTSIMQQWRSGQLQLASYLIDARALLEYVIFILWVRSVTKMLPSVKFAEGKLLTFLILREKC